ncbi:hypothetical protein N0V90_008063 [Kalmusia sp. IMI 367209]|nr:hypothetical protein N0V90_008063 [Kalmusia sp. IMI 367209]
MIQILQIDCTPANHHNIYGQVVDGFLDLSVRLVKLSVRVDRSGYNGNVQWHVIAPSDGSTSIINLAFDVLEMFEEAENQEMGLEVFCALLAPPSRFGNDGSTSLVLRSKGRVEDMIFERVGVAKVKVSTAEYSARMQSFHARRQSRRRRRWAREENNEDYDISESEEETDEDSPYMSIVPSTIRIV